MWRTERLNGASVKLLHDIAAAGKPAVRRPFRAPSIAPKGPDSPGLKEMEEPMEPIANRFNQAADPPAPGFSLFWMMVWAIAILDDSDDREKDRHNRPPRPPPPRR